MLSTRGVGLHWGIIHSLGCCATCAPSCSLATAFPRHAVRVLPILPSYPFLSFQRACGHRISLTCPRSLAHAALFHSLPPQPTA
eukprot:6174010-Pleurochrysis_carterae.AAC.1